MTDFVRLGQRAAYYELLSVRRDFSAEDREFYRQIGEKFRQMQSDALERAYPIQPDAIVAAVKQEPEYRIHEWPDPAPDFPHANVLRQRSNVSHTRDYDDALAPFIGVRNGLILLAGAALLIWGLLL